MADQVYKVRDPAGNVREIRGPAGASDAEVIAQAQRLFAPKAPKESAAMKEGRQMNSSAQGGITALQGPTMGFLDELAGAGSAITGAIANITPWGDDKTIAENYRSGRDKVRGATEQFKADRPMTAMATQFAASAPTIVAAPFRAASAVPQIVGPGARILQAAKTGAAYGGVGGFGESTAQDAAGMVADALAGAAGGAATGAALTGGGAAVGAVGRNVAQRVRPASATEAAREKVAEALIRDARGTAFQFGRSSPLDQAQARLQKLGPEATIADSGGRSVNTLLDTLATLPGRTKNAAENLIHARQAGRAGRLTGAADDALGTAGKGYSATLEALDNAKRTAAAPLYEKLKGVSVRIDKDLNGMLQAAEKAHGGAETLAKLRQELPIDLSKLKAGDDVPFAALDKVKQSLYDLGQSAKQGGNKELGRAYDDLRKRLTAKLDDLSPKDKAGSIYRQARDAYSGPSQLADAIEAGRGAMKTDAIGVAELTRGMSASEREAFRVGALQSIKDKAGRESGQTELLKMWKEPATSGKLKEIFGNDYRQFAAAVAAEARLKSLENVGRGSQTASRIYGAGDLDEQAAYDVGNMVSGAAQGRVTQALAGAANVWNRVKTPETVRDEIGRILMSRGAQGGNELTGMAAAVRRVAEERARRAAQTGAAGSLYLAQ